MPQSNKIKILTFFGDPADKEDWTSSYAARHRNCCRIAKVHGPCKLLFLNLTRCRWYCPQSDFHTTFVLYTGEGTVKDVKKAFRIAWKAHWEGPQ